MGNPLEGKRSPLVAVLCGNASSNEQWQAGGVIERLTAYLAEADSLIACHQYSIDKRPPETWPRDSALRRAVQRHEARSVCDAGEET